MGTRPRRPGGGSRRRKDLRRCASVMASWWPPSIPLLVSSRSAASAWRHVVGVDGGRHEGMGETEQAGWKCEESAED